MYCGSWHLAYKAVFSLIIIIYLMPESWGGRRSGRIKQFARVNETVDMDPRSMAEPFCQIKANAHLFPGAKVGAYAFIDENVLLFDYCTIQSHVHIQQRAQIGNRTTIETHTNIGRRAKVLDGVVIMEHTRVMSNAVIGRYCLIDQHVRIGRRARLRSRVYVGQNVQVGSKTVLGHNAIVEGFVIMHSGMRIKNNTVVVSAPETTILLRMVRGVKFSDRFHRAANLMVQQSDRMFAEQFSNELNNILSDLGTKCTNDGRFAPQVVYLVYSYLLKVYGNKRLRKLRIPKSTQIVIHGRLQADVNDCNDPQRYDILFNKRTTEKFVLVLAIYYDFYRRNRMDNDGTLDDFCSVVKDIMANKRKVVAINETCGGHLKANCKACNDDDERIAPESYLIRRNDMNYDYYSSNTYDVNFF